jgi:hypothetical protein
MNSLPSPSFLEENATKVIYIDSKMTKSQQATTMEQRSSSGSSALQMWKMKKKQQKSRTSTAAAIALDGRRNRLASPTSNFFTQMGDDEVGNHNSSDAQTFTTEPTASVSTASKSISREVRGDNDKSMPLLLFKPHASTEDDDEYHYLSPQVTPTRVLKNSSPQSVIESVDKQQLTLEAFPRHAKKVQQLSQVDIRLDRHDSSYEESDIDIANEDSSNIVDDDDASVNTILIDKTISDSLPPMLNKFHDFIIGAPCWSSGNMSQSLLCVGDAANANCNDINMEEDNDDDDNNNDEEHSYTSNDDDDASFYTSDASSHQPIVRRRGRSPTVKEGYNSDGESLRSRSTCSRGSFWTDTNNTMDKSVESASHNSVDATVIDSLERGGDANCSISSSASIEIATIQLGTSFVSIDGVIDLDANGTQGKASSVDSTVANENTSDERSDNDDNDISTISEELLTNDQANWICMTRDEASVGNADSAGIADSGHSEAYVEGTDGIEDYFKVSAIFILWMIVILIVSYSYISCLLFPLVLEYHNGRYPAYSQRPTVINQWIPPE